MRIHTALATAGVILAAASATACSGGSKAGQAAPPASSGAAGASGPAANPGAGAGSSSVKNFDVCTALTAAQASQITGTTFSTTKSSSTEGVIFSCEYDGPNSALLQIAIETPNGRDAFSLDVSALKSVQHPPTAVSGVGDEAFSEPDPNGNAGSAGASAFASYGAVFGNTYIKVGGLTYVTADQGRQIVEALHSKL
jgi:hypothetical protein